MSPADAVNGASLGALTSSPCGVRRFTSRRYPPEKRAPVRLGTKSDGLKNQFVQLISALLDRKGL